MFHRSFKTALATYLSVALASCSKPNPEPEKLDPIYNDLLARQAASTSAAGAKKQEIKSVEAELASLPPRDPTRKKTLENLRRAERQLMVAEQEALFYQIRAESRQAAARDEYRKAFRSGETWPKPEDFENYKAAIKLRDGPREWNQRVPKTGRYNKKTDEELKKEFEERLKAAAPAK